MKQQIKLRQKARVETGVVQFQNADELDWPGVFLRGDFCIGAIPKLRQVIHYYWDNGPGSDFVRTVELAPLEQLLTYMEDAIFKPVALPPKPE